MRGSALDVRISDRKVRQRRRGQKAQNIPARGKVDLRLALVVPIVAVDHRVPALRSRAM